MLDGNMNTPQVLSQTSTEQRKICKPHKVYIPRKSLDYSQPLRYTVQLLFLLLNLALAVQFYRFVRQFETSLISPELARPAGIEGWLPIAGLMNLKTLLLTGYVPSIHPAALFLLLAFLTTSFLLRKSFCGWLCPVGTVSERLWKFGQKTFGHNWTLPKWLDIPLRSLKYILLGLFAAAVVSMTVVDLQSFLLSPYGLIVDVKMLNFFRNLGVIAAVVIGSIVLLSIAVKNFWCRYLCPYGALMGLASLASPVWIRREEKRCVDCHKCTRACPSGLPVDKSMNIRSAECIGCLECVAVCPAEGALQLSVLGITPLGRKRTEPWVFVAVLALVFFGIVGYAKWNGLWQSPIPAATYQRLIPHAWEFDHPR